MLERKLTPAEIVAELIEIEIEILNRMQGASASQE
jgi:hypothetical protein